MTSETDLPHQPDTLQQLPQMEHEGSPFWIMIFIALILINGVFFYFAGVAVNQTAGGVSGIGIIPFLFLLALIDFLAVFFYIRKQHPHGIARVISYTVLILIAFYLVQVVIGIFLIALPMSLTSF